MTEEQVEQAVLKYLHKDPEDRHFQSLTTLFEMVMKPSEPRADAFDIEDEIDTKEELRAALDAMVQDGLVESRWGERDYESSYRLTDEGAYEASGFDAYVEVPTNAITTEDGDPILTEDGKFIITEGPAADETRASLNEQMTIESASWTGLTKVIIDARNVKAVSSLIDKAMLALPASRAGNFEVMQASAYLKAAKELLDAPQPPSEEIWQLISKAADLVGLIGLFYTIFVQAMS